MSSKKYFAIVGSVLCATGILFTQLSYGQAIPFKIIVSPNPAGVAIGGIDGTHAGTQQFTAIELNVDGSINSKPNLIWTSSNQAVATLATEGSQFALATGVESGTTIITAKDVVYPNIYNSVTLTVHKIGDAVAIGNNSGLVYCMGTGTDITNCVYLPPGKIGGVISPENNSVSALWWNSFYSQTNAISPNDGATNTKLIAAQPEFLSSYAAGVCQAVGPNWYLPAISELKVMVKNEIALNNQGNANLTPNGYWSSTEFTTEPGVVNYTDAYAMYVDFYSGFQSFDLKYDNHHVRCVHYL